MALPLSVIDIGIRYEKQLHFKRKVVCYETK